MRERLEKLLAQHPERAEIALALAQLCLREKEAEAALRYAEQAIQVDSGYSAALLVGGQAALVLNDAASARNWFTRGLRAAEQRGDKQIERQIQVFLKRMGSTA